jgi:hypothetical protein
MRALLDDHIINDFFFVIDESSSMRRHTSTVVRVFDGLIADLAAQSKEFGQETRVSIYAVGSHGTERCILWDRDVSGIPSIKGRYEPDGLTAVADCTHLVLDDLSLIPQKYCNRAVAITVVTDGQENDSRRGGGPDSSAHQLRGRIATLPGNVALGVYVPDRNGANYAEIKCGYPADAIKIWNPAGANAIEQLGREMADTARSYMQARATARSTGQTFTGRSLFGFSAADVQATLTPITPGAYGVYDVTRDTQIDLFIEQATRRPYQKGRVYYQLTKPVSVQDYKDVLIETGGQVYSGPLDKARALLGLPGHAVKVSPRDLETGGCTVFIQSTSYNRKLLAGTRVVVLR